MSTAECTHSAPGARLSGSGRRSYQLLRRDSRQGIGGNGRGDGSSGTDEARAFKEIAAVRFRPTVFGHLVLPPPTAANLAGIGAFLKRVAIVAQRARGG